jgi:hypothetical protein
MILARQKTLQPTSNTCIWCDRRFLPNGLKQDRTVNFGPVERTQEHIIPSNLFGRVITLDVCKCCNESFGSRMDHELTRDKRVHTAATEAGVRIREYRKRYRSIRQSEDGRKFESTHCDGSDRIEPKLNDLARLSIGVVGGKVREVDLKNLKNRLVGKLRKKFMGHGLPSDWEDRVDLLMAAIRNSPDRLHYDSVLGERFNPTPLLPFEEIQTKSSPWIADWCVAKMMYETGACLMPMPFLDYLRPVQEHLRAFVRNGLSAKVCDRGTSILESGNDKQSGLKHSIVITATQTAYKSGVRLFGSAWWRFSASLKPIRPPARRGFRVEVANPLGREGEEVSVRVTEL